MNREHLFLKLICGVALIVGLVCLALTIQWGGDDGMLGVKIASCEYRNAKRILKLEVDYENSFSEPVFLIANEYDFAPLFYDDIPQRLNIVDDGRELLIDLTEPTITDAIQVATSEGYTYSTGHTELIHPNDKFHAVYWFKFPSRLERVFSTAENVGLPTGKRIVKFQVGWGQGKDISDFAGEVHERFKPALGTHDDQLVRLNSLIRTEWQHVSVVSCEVDFGAPSPTKSEPSRK